MNEGKFDRIFKSDTHSPYFVFNIEVLIHFLSHKHDTILIVQIIIIFQHW